MKWFVLFISLVQCFFCVASIRTVSNNPSTVGQYNTIQLAIDASASGDTVLVHGSTLNYSGFTISNKRIILIGPGFGPDVQQSLVVKVGSTFMITGAASKKTEIQGIVFIGDTYITGSIDTLYFYRNNFDDFFINPFLTVRGLHFSGNYFRGIFNSHPATINQNFLFENNVFEFGGAGACFASFNNAANNNILFNHNLFFSGSGTPSNMFSEVSNVLFVNNIFVERNFNGTITQSSFQNNITFNCSPNNPWSINGNIDVGGNIENMDPQMADQVSVNNGNAGDISNYTIASGPANNSASDGKDMGLLYDAVGWLNWIHGRNSRLPSVVLMNITNPVMVAGETLNINLEARKNE